MAANPKMPRDKNVEVYFGTESGPPEEAVLVDFEGGKVSYNRAGSGGEERRAATDRVDDEAAFEVLLLMPDGKLMVRDQSADKDDKDRKDRVEAYDKRIDDVKKEKAPMKPGDSGLFDGRKGS